MKLKYYYFLLFVPLLVSCKKDFLEAKPDKMLVVPSTLQDFQALLDNADIMNFWMPYLGEIAGDDYYLQDDSWKSLSYPPEKNGYVWAKEIFAGNSSPDWENMYRIVFYANNVLEGLEKMRGTDNPQTYREIKGAALFFRGYAFYQLSQLFCAAYSASSSNDGLGIPLRLKSDINLPSVRATIAQTYAQILEDLLASAPLLPLHVAIKTRPGKTAAYAMLSKVYLLTQDYNRSLLYADSALLQPGNALINLNNVDTLASYPMVQYNPEVILQTTLNYASNFTSSRINIDSTLFDSYVKNDIRKKAWFTTNNGRIIFKGNYNGSSPYYFSGLGLNEMYLNKAECLVRIGKIQEAMNTLNTLLKERFRTGTFTSLSASGADEALAIILQERRKELLLRGIRWSDLRRLNLEPNTAKILYRVIDGQTYKLLPNSPNYVFPIEDQVIQLSGIEQNVRN
jgi:starch-binding outer membrane protein, SusD/RagB family